MNLYELYEISTSQLRETEQEAVELFYAKEQNRNGSTSGVVAAGEVGQTNPIAIKRQYVDGFQGELLWRAHALSLGLAFNPTDVMAAKQTEFRSDLKGPGLLDVSLKLCSDPTKPPSWTVSNSDNMFWKKIAAGISLDRPNRLLKTHWITHGSICFLAHDQPIAPKLKYRKRMIYFDPCTHAEWDRHRPGFIPLCQLTQHFIPFEQLRILPEKV